MRSRWTAYAGLSVALAGGVIVKSLAQRPNFYSAAVYLSQSSANLMILTNLVFVTACTLLLFLQKLLYGPLRPIEIEQLYEKAWFAVTETCLAMTIFRGEIGAWFLVMFFSLLAAKVWGWIGEGRVEVLEQQPPHNPRLFHTRLAVSLGLSVFFDVGMLEYVIRQVTHMARPDMMVMFGFEFAVLTITSLSTAARYAVNLTEIGIVRGQKQKRIKEVRRERILTAMRAYEASYWSGGEAAQEVGQGARDGITSPSSSTPNRRFDPISVGEAAAAEPIDDADLEVEGWDNKGRWIFYLDLATDFWKLVVYLSFFFILLIFYGLPLHIMRDVFLTCRSFFKRIGDFLRYRAATRDMNERYPDATAEEINRADSVCIICREEMRPYQAAADGAPGTPVAERMRPKKLPCGHILHFSCLRSWLERQQICPTCRTSVISTSQTRPASGGAPVDGAAAPPGADGHPAPGRDRVAPRVYRFGPLRIGVGAARGNNMLEELQRQLGDADIRQARAQNANGPQQYGFGIRWDGIRRRGERGEPVVLRGTVQEQLDALEVQLQQELDAIGRDVADVAALRDVQDSLTHLRQARTTGAPATETQRMSGLPERPPMPWSTQTTNRQSVAASSAHTPLIAGPPSNVLQANSDQLPQGLTLPEGWSMVPLHPITRPADGPPQQGNPNPVTQITASAVFPLSAIPQLPGSNPFQGLPRQPQPFPRMQAQHPPAGPGVAPTAPSTLRAQRPETEAPVISRTSDSLSVGDPAQSGNPADEARRGRSQGPENSQTQQASVSPLRTLPERSNIANQLRQRNMRSDAATEGLRRSDAANTGDTQPSARTEPEQEGTAPTGGGVSRAPTVEDDAETPD